MESAEGGRPPWRLGERSLPRRARAAGPMQFHDERTKPRARRSADGRDFLDAVDRRKVGMIQRREDLSLPGEPREPLGIIRESRGQHCDRDVTVDLRIPATSSSPPINLRSNGSSFRKTSIHADVSSSHTRASSAVLRFGVAAHDGKISFPKARAGKTEDLPCAGPTHEL